MYLMTSSHSCRTWLAGIANFRILTNSLETINRTFLLIMQPDLHSTV
jgi:hypothetical protein